MALVLEGLSRKQQPLSKKQQSGQSVKQQPPLVLEVLSDSDYLSCRNTRRSISGYILRLAGCTISWRSRKQCSLATSILEAEYMALAIATKQHFWLLRGLTELGNPNIQHLLKCDNSGTIDLVHNLWIGECTKHIQVSYHFVRELVKTRTLTVLHISREHNIVDIYTKALPGP